ALGVGDLDADLGPVQAEVGLCALDEVLRLDILERTQETRNRRLLNIVQRRRGYAPAPLGVALDSEAGSTALVFDADGVGHGPGQHAAVAQVERRPGNQGEEMR